MFNYYQAVHEIIQTGHWITDQVSQELKEYGVTEPQYNVLRTLKANSPNPVTVQEIQDRMVQRTSNVTRIVDKLLDKGYAKRKICPSNRRKMDITITVNGKEFLSLLDKKVTGFHQPMRGNLTTDELYTLAALIIKLRGDNT